VQDFFDGVPDRTWGGSSVPFESPNQRQITANHPTTNKSTWHHGGLGEDDTLRSSRTGKPGKSQSSRGVGKGRGARAAAGVPSMTPSFIVGVVLRLAAAERSASQAVGVRAPTIGGNRRSGCKARPPLSPTSSRGHELPAAPPARIHRRNVLEMGGGGG
jgi:hypothetical protein